MIGLESCGLYPIDDIYQISSFENCIEIQAREDGRVEITVSEPTEGDSRSGESSITLTIGQANRLSDSLIRASEKAKYLARERHGPQGAWMCECISSGETFYVDCPYEMRAYIESGLFKVEAAGEYLERTNRDKINE